MTRPASQRTLALVDMVYAARPHVVRRLAARYPRVPSDLIDEATDEGISRVAVDLWLGMQIVPHGTRDPRRWLIACAFTSARDAYRRECGRRVRHATHHAETRETFLSAYTTGTVPVAGAVAEQVAAIVDGFDDRAREVVWMAANIGMTGTARELGVGYRSVYNRMERARCVVADALGDPEPLRLLRKRLSAEQRHYKRKRLGL